MSDVSTLPAGSTYRAESFSDTPIYSALAAANPLFAPTIVMPRRPAHRQPASLSRTCLVPRSPMGGRHRLAPTHAEPVSRTGRHHLVTPSYT
ncbi:MAG: hypothetical protein QOH17_2421 [Pseudonocardiales bacterium]|nr:hypothetical protein [Pseudonocardiales bacterium]